MKATQQEKQLYCKHCDCDRTFTLEECVLGDTVTGHVYVCGDCGHEIECDGEDDDAYDRYKDDQLLRGL